MKGGTGKTSILLAGIVFLGPAGLALEFLRNHVGSLAVPTRGGHTVAERLAKQRSTVEEQLRSDFERTGLDWTPVLHGILLEDLRAFVSRTRAW